MIIRRDLMENEKEIKQKTIQEVIREYDPDVIEKYIEHIKKMQEECLKKVERKTNLTEFSEVVKDEKEIGILAEVDCCGNGCIFSDNLNGCSVREGTTTVASGNASHAEGSGTTASGFASHAQGNGTIANSLHSHTEGVDTSSNGMNGVHIMGSYGEANDLPFSWYLANGIGPANRGLAAKILRNGTAFADVGWFGGGADYAEMFESVDGQPMDVGYFVTLKDDKICKATEQETMF